VGNYLITDGDRFIYRNHSGKYVPVKSESMADLYSKKQAEAIHANCIPKSLRKLFRVERSSVIQVDKSIKPPDAVQISNNTEKVMLSTNIQLWVDKIKDLNGLAAEVSERKETLLNQLRDVDKKISDINHYIEFTKLNASQGFKAYKLIKDNLSHRRVVKNELTVLNIILDYKLDEAVEEEIMKRIEGLDKRNYKPRILEELFDI